MTKIGHIIRYEIVTMLTRPSFLVLSFGVPLLAVVILTAISFARGDGADGGAGPAGPEVDLEPEGYVDQAGLIETLPPDLPPDILVPYATEEQAQDALRAGSISAYYVIPPDFIETGSLLYVQDEATPFSSDSQAWIIRWAMIVNLLGGDVLLASRVLNPAQIEETNLAPAAQGGAAAEDCSRPNYRCESSYVVAYIPMVMVVLFFVFLMTGSGLLLRSVTTEKENRLMEILMVSIAPRQLLIGKIIGLGVVSLLQVVVWLGCGYLMLRLGGNTLRLPEDFTFPAEILAWAIVLFLLGYTLYAALMAGAGALLPRVKESSQAAWVVMWPMFLAYMAAIILGMSRPSHLLMIAMSLFPLTSPLVMIVRITISDVPVWQLVVCVALLVVTVVLVVMAVERMFRAQTLISGQPFSARKYLQALLGRA